MPFAAMWMDLENIMLSEISQGKTNTVCYHLYVESKIIQTNVYGKTEINIKNKLVVTCRERRRGGACQVYDVKR